MKILIVTTVSVTLNFFESQINELVNKGYEVHVASNFEELSMDNFNPDIIKHQIDFSRSLIDIRNIRASRQIKKLIAKSKFDIIHTHTPIASAIVRIFRNRSSEVIYTAHGFHFYKGAPITNWLVFYPVEKILSNRTDHLITINKEDFNIAKEKFKMGSLHLINGPGVDIDAIKNASLVSREKLGLSEKDFVLVFGAELNENKNQYLLIDSIKVLVSKYPNIKLLLIGKDNNNNKYQEYTKLLEVEKNILFLGVRSDLKGIIKSCNLAVSSSKREGLGLFLIEAGINGLPIVATDNRGSREIIEHEKNGLLCNFTPKEFAESIEYVMLNNEKFVNRINENKGMYEKFSDEKVQKKIMNIYEICMKGRI